MRNPRRPWTSDDPVRSSIGYCTAAAVSAPPLRSPMLVFSSGDRIRFTDEPPEQAGEDTSTPAQPWVILIVDDDQGVHDATVLALQGERVRQRSLEFRHAYSAAEARDLLATDPRIGLLLLDVVMETSDAGLKLVARIRSEFAQRRIRILLRTGQPGQAPEHDIRSKYAVDGYLTKARLTRSLLLEALHQALDDGNDAGGTPRH